MQLKIQGIRHCYLVPRGTPTHIAKMLLTTRLHMGGSPSLLLLPPIFSMLPAQGHRFTSRSLHPVCRGGSSLLRDSVESFAVVGARTTVQGPQFTSDQL